MNSATEKLTDQLIAQLSQGVKAQKPADSLTVFGAKFLAAAALVTAAWLIVLPWRANLADDWHRGFFVLNTLVSGLLATASAAVAYHRRLPGLSSKNWEIAAYALIAVFFVSVFAQPSVTSASFLDEARADRGVCGFLILAIAASWSVALFWWARRGAVTRAASTGAWIALSTGALAAFAMQVVCEQESSLHLLLWHAVPVGVITYLGTLVGRRVLRW